jgi:hypothetical protein
MRQKLYTILIALAALAMYTSASAQTAAVGDKFKADNLYYVITKLSPAEVEVASQHNGSPRWDETEMPTGDVVIPATVRYNEIDYAVTAVRDFTFNECGGLTSLTIPRTVRSIGLYTLAREAFSLTQFIVDEANPDFLSEDGVIFNKDTTILVAMPAGKTGSYTMPNTVKRIRRYSCSKARISSINFSNSLEVIEYMSFSGCKNLTSLSFPATVTTIEGFAFIGCSSLTTITLPEGLTSIEDHAFSDCIGIASITLPASLTSIGKGAFINWKALTAFTVADGNPAFSSDDTGALFNKDKTTLLQIPKGNKSITAYTVPATVTGIEYPGFTGCDNIINITLPEGLTSIGDEAFLGCGRLKEINCLVADPESITMGADVFIYIPKGTAENPCILKVPVGSKEKYAAADQWKDFMPGIVEEGTGLASLTSHGIRVWGGKGVIKIVPPNFLKGEFGADVKVYDLTGTLVRTLPLGGGDILVANIPAGKYIVKIGDAAEKVVVR